MGQPAISKSVLFAGVSLIGGDNFEMSLQVWAPNNANLRDLATDCKRFVGKSRGRVL
jgi:hypothetical protein